MQALWPLALLGAAILAYRFGMAALAAKLDEKAFKADIAALRAELKALDERVVPLENTLRSENRMAQLTGVFKR